MLYLKSVLVITLLFNTINQINCNNDKIQSEEENYDEVGEKFLSLLSENLKMKIMKNKAANDGILDPTKFKKEDLTKEELAEMQQALVQAMQPLFGKFVNELASNYSANDEDKSEEILEIDGPDSIEKESQNDKIIGESVEDKLEKSGNKNKEKISSKKENQETKKQDKKKTEKTKKESKKNKDNIKEVNKKGKKKKDEL